MYDRVVTGSGVDQLRPEVAEVDRRATVLESALATFARYGYRKTSMEEVARAAHISRPGLYFLFESKEALFRSAVTRALERDIAVVERVLAANDRPLRERLLKAFDQWAGGCIGPLTSNVAVVIEDNPGLLGTIVDTAPRRFEQLVIDALGSELRPDTAEAVAQTLMSTSIGIKHQVETREAYRERLEVAIELLIR